MKWIDIGNSIVNDWYEIRCQINQMNSLKIYLYGLKNEKNQYCIDFGEILLYQVNDEGWDLNPIEYRGCFKESPLVKQAILVQLFDSHLSTSIQEKYQNLFHHYQVFGINFRIEIIAKGLPSILKILE